MEGPLTRPNGTDPDGFLRRVAAAYDDATTRTSKPAKALAQEAGVPVGTVHRWVREARQRGHLPPTKQGRARSRSALELVADELGVSPERLRHAITRHAPGGLRP